jgi:ABC-type sugar transport system ATPase subunit
VTHDVQTVRSFCDRAVWLDGGLLRSIGSPIEITSEYVRELFGNQVGEEEAAGEAGEDERTHAAEGTGATHENGESSSEGQWLTFESRTDLVRWGSGELVIERASIDNGECRLESIFEGGEKVRIRFQVRAIQDIRSSGVGFAFAFRNNKGLDIITSTTYDEGQRFNGFSAGEKAEVRFELENILAPGEYALVLCVEDRTHETPRYYDFIENATVVKIMSTKKIFSVVLPSVTQTVVRIV